MQLKIELDSGGCDSQGSTN